VGETPYISTFSWKGFLLGWIRKIQKHKEERDRSGKFKKTMEERKTRDFYIPGGSHTHVFCIGQTTRATALVRPSLRRTHSYGNLPTTLNCH
jgi:hypothetical protein